MRHLHQITQHRIANLLRGAVRKNRACFLFQCSQFVIQRIIFLIGKNFPVLLIICLRRPVQLLHQLLYSLCHIASLTVSAYLNQLRQARHEFLRPLCAKGNGNLEICAAVIDGNHCANAVFRRTHLIPHAVAQLEILGRRHFLFHADPAEFCCRGQHILSAEGRLILRHGIIFFRHIGNLSGRHIYQIRRNFLQEARRRIILRNPMLHAAFCVRQVKLLLRTGNAHIAKSAFLLNFLFTAIHYRTEAGENSLLHTDDENIGEFQTLRAVQCHEGNGFLSLLIAVNIRNESNLLQKAFQLAFGVSFIIFRRFIHKFINILDTVQRVIRPLCHQQL